MDTTEICLNCNCEILIPISEKKAEYLCPNCKINITVFKNHFLQIDFDLKQSKDIICIDFGTSSLRAAIQKVANTTSTIEIGKQFQSQIDDLSIPSAIWISGDGNSIEFGERAIQFGFNQAKYKSLLFDISPKKWLTNGYEIYDINQPILKNGITKAHLISGLISLAIFGVSKELKISFEELRKCEIRISHPIWDKKIQNKLQITLEKLLSDSVLIWDRAVNGIKPKELFSILENRVASIVYSRQEVLEPIAAAISLFEEFENSMAFVVVIDVGAGTTDMAAFYSTVPDSSTRGAVSGKYKRQLLPLGIPLSLFKAGDQIDDVIMEILFKKIVGLSSTQKQDLLNRKRVIKESLFKYRKTVEYGEEVSYQDILNHINIKEFIKEIKKSFDTLILSCEDSLAPRIKSNAIHRIDSVKVVFAGGGGKIQFLRNAIGAKIDINKTAIPIEVVDITKTNKLHTLIERLAVSIGGTTHKDDWPKVTTAEIKSIRGLLL
jgi:hypothetical protein